MARLDFKIIYKIQLNLGNLWLNFNTNGFCEFASPKGTGSQRFEIPNPGQNRIGKFKK